MTQITVNETVYQPGQLLANQDDRITIEISLAGADGRPVDGFHLLTGSNIVGPFRFLLPGSGQWSRSLHPNAEIVPANTVYRRTVEGPNFQYADYFIVPTTGGPYTVQALLSDPPAALTSAALTVHDTTRSKHVPRIELFEHQPGVHRLRQRIAVARQQSPGLSAMLLVIGDSIVRFQASKYRNAWIERVRRAMQGQFPGTLGLLPASEALSSILDVDWPGGDNPWTYAGGCTANIDFGIGQHAVNIPQASGGTATLTYFGDKITLYYVRTTTGPTACAVTLDGVAQSTFNANGAELPGQAVNYGTHGQYGFHTIVITPNSGTLILEGAQWFDGDAPFFINGGVQMLDASHGGFSTTFWADPADNNWSAALAIGGLNGVCIIELGANDITLGVTAQQFEDNLVTIASRVEARVAAGNVSFLLLIVPGITNQSYIDRYYTAQARIGYDKCSVLDLGKLRADRLFGSELSSDAIHPNDAGHIWMAQEIIAALDPSPQVGDNPVTPLTQIIDATTPVTFRSSWTAAIAAIAGTSHTYDEATASAIRERRHRVWADPGTYQGVLTAEHATGRGDIEVLMGRWVGNTPTLTSMGSVDTSTPAGPALTTSVLATTVTTDVPAWVPVVIRKTNEANVGRFVQLRLNKTA